MNNSPQAAAVQRMSSRELVEIFSELEAPSIDEMHGDFAATLLRQPSAFAEFSGNLSVNPPWKQWKSKGFRPVDARSGRGYNSFTRGFRIVQSYPMQTRIAPSRFDGKPAYHLIYGAYRSTCGLINMVDEVRRVETGTWLGIGTWGFWDAQRRTPLPFLLEDVGLPYIGDIGKQKRGFVPGTREIPAMSPAADLEAPERSVA